MKIPFLGAAFSFAQIAEENMKMRNKGIILGEDKPNSPGNP